MKLLFLSEGVSFAHIGRPLSLAESAANNGFDVHFACNKDALKKISFHSQLFDVHSIFTIKSELFYGRIDNGKFFYTQDELKKYVEEEINLIRKINPDLIISDFRLTSAISSKLTNKPLINLSNSYWSPYYSCPFPAPNVGIFKYLSNKSTDFMFKLLRPIAFRTFGNTFNEVRKFYGLNAKKDFREIYTEGTYTAYMDMPDFVNLKSLPNNHFYLGPISWSPDISENIRITGKKNIYISMGSTGGLQNLNLILKSVLNMGYRIILSGINKTYEEYLYKQLPNLKDNSIIKSLLKPENILGNCSLTICHGGSSTVYQSLSYGVPVLCFPNNPDQSLVAMAIQEKNLGRYIQIKNITDQTIQVTLQNCISNEVIHQNAYRYSLKMKSHNTLKYWTHFLNQFKTLRKSTKEIA